MKKIKVPNSTIGTYWVWEMPEITDEIHQLFVSAGDAKVIRTTAMGVVVEVKLNQPAKVINWNDDWGDGNGINSATLKCIGTRPSIDVGVLPKSGDSLIKLFIELELHTFNERDTVDLDDVRNALKEFAEKMTKTWYYHF